MSPVQFTSSMAMVALVHYSVAGLLLLYSTCSAACSSIFSFGDSISDTGNLLYYLHNHHWVGDFPYGETFFHRSTGRFSDGRLIIDFLAEYMELPLLPPCLAGPRGGDFRSGVNFAFGGASALNSSFYQAKGLPLPERNVSLHDQIEWFKQAMPSICSSTSDCEDVLSRSLFVVGPIGGNDYNYPINQGASVDEARTIILPAVIQAITSGVNKLIELGARTMVVPGSNPLGCLPFQLSLFQNSKKEDYDPQIGCLKSLNELSRHHNKWLQYELRQIKLQHPHVTIIYADYFEGLINILRSPELFGFTKRPLVSCCGGDGGPHCGEAGYSACMDPSKYVFWDGTHLTEAAYRVMARGVIDGPYAVPSVGYACSLLRMTHAIRM